MLTPNFEINETKDGFAVKDNTDYSTQQFIGTYGLNDYGANPSPSANTSFSTTVISINGEVIFDNLVEYVTDGTGNIFDAESAYNYIIGVVNGNETPYRARLNKNDSDSYRVWRLEFYSFDPSTEGYLIDVTSTMTPIVSQFAGQNDITFRNLIVLDPDGNVVDLGGIAQESEIVFNYDTYEEGKIITLSFCSDSLVYTIVNNDTDCIIKDIVDLLQTENANLAYYTIDIKKVDNKITLKQTSVGVPFSVSISIDDPALVDPFTNSLTVENKSTMTIPTVLTDNEVVDVVETDRGGEYTVSMTVGSVCDKGTTTVPYFSWVYDDKELDCCFNKALSKNKCCAKTTEQILNTSALRNVIYGIEIAKEDNRPPKEIQSLYNLGHDSCESCACCDGCS